MSMTGLVFCSTEK
uniref:Uncharacterized protein n=1 Tax=Anguilla anguilla TaxID=7936 RepID=A0A0E9U4Z4_ANGAN